MRESLAACDLPDLLCGVSALHGGTQPLAGDSPPIETSYS